MSEGSPRLTVMLIRRFLVAAYRLTEPKRGRWVVGLEEVGREMGVHDRDLLEKISGILIVNKDLKQASGANESGMFRVTQQGREKVHRWQREGRL
jgi:hypothetical protein